MRRSPLRGAAWIAASPFLASCGEGATSAARALAVVALVGLVAALVRRRASAPASPALEVPSRAALGRDSGVALVRARGESFLVGWGRDGVRLVARLGREGRP